MPNSYLGFTLPLKPITSVGTWLLGSISMSEVLGEAELKHIFSKASHSLSILNTDSTLPKTTISQCLKESY